MPVWITVQGLPPVPSENGNVDQGVPQRALAALAECDAIGETLLSASLVMYVNRSSHVDTLADFNDALCSHLTWAGTGASGTSHRHCFFLPLMPCRCRLRGPGAFHRPQ